MVETQSRWCANAPGAFPCTEFFQSFEVGDRCTALIRRAGHTQGSELSRRNTLTHTSQIHVVFEQAAERRVVEQGVRLRVAAAHRESI